MARITQGAVLIGRIASFALSATSLPNAVIDENQQLTAAKVFAPHSPHHDQRVGRSPWTAAGPLAGLAETRASRADEASAPQVERVTAMLASRSVEFPEFLKGEK